MIYRCTGWPCRSAAASVIKNDVGGSMRIPILVGLSALFLSSAGFEAGAAEKMYGPGVTDTEIKIGQTVPYSGPASAFSSYGRVMTGYFQSLTRRAASTAGRST